jgi:gamma-glutamyltranspeptidase/glutathione hydrolase
MATHRLGVAAGNRLGTDAAVKVAREGGNAVDACLAAAVMGWVAEPFFASVAGSGFITLRTPEGKVEVIDGNSVMPFTVPREPGEGIRRIFLPDYADGIYMGIAGGAVAIPGILAAVRVAWERHGKIEWAALFTEAIAAAREGIAFPKTSDYYLSCTWEAIWSRYPEPARVFSVDGRPMREGELCKQPELGDALESIANEGPQAFYSGNLAREIVDAIQADGGFMTREDLASHKAEVRAPISAVALGWDVWSNPPPSVGGVTLVHMLALLEHADLGNPVEALRAIVEAQRAAVGYRKERYQDPSSVAVAFEEALSGLDRRAPRSSDTTHMSAADVDGNVCSITESNGYGSGLSVHGMLLNNTLGEEELNPLGFHRLPPGSRCHSNMTPTIVRGSGRTIGLGSPGADRIVGAIAQTFLRLAVEGADLTTAVSAPRAHLDPRPEGERLCYEPGLPGDKLDYTPRPYDDVHMFFGAVQAASVADDGTVEAVHDPRRSGGSALV